MEVRFFKNWKYEHKRENTIRKDAQQRSCADV